MAGTTPIPTQPPPNPFDFVDSFLIIDDTAIGATTTPTPDIIPWFNITVTTTSTTTVTTQTTTTQTTKTTRIPFICKTGGCKNLGF